jgi:sulfur-oxidizing protein SoxY
MIRIPASKQAKRLITNHSIWRTTIAVILSFMVSQITLAENVQSLNNAQALNNVEVLNIGSDHEAEVDERWLTVRQAVLGDIEIHDGRELIQINAPERAYDAAFVPVSVEALQEQTDEHYIKELYILVDKNPAPVAGKFYFQPNTGWQNLETRIRVNEYTFVRAVAIAQDDKAYMVSKFVKASGGCSTPATGAPPTANEAGLQANGVGNFKFKLESSPVPQSDSERMQLNVQIKHPNNTGMQFDQLSRIYIPAYFIHTIGVKYDGKEIIKLETNFSLSENPTLRFDFIPEKSGGLIDVYAIDSKLEVFEQQWSS